MPPGEHFLYPHVTCHKICPTPAATDSRSQASSAITGDSINTPAATECLLFKRCRLPSNLIQTPHLPAAALRGPDRLFSLNVNYLSGVDFLCSSKDRFPRPRVRHSTRSVAIRPMFVLKRNVSRCCAYLHLPLFAGPR